MVDIKTTFVPKKPILATKRRNIHKFDPISFFGWVVFFTALAVTVGIYSYQFLIDRTIQSKLDDIKLAKNAIDPVLVESFKELDTKLQTARALVDGHISALPVLEFLEKETLLTVGFSNMNYEVLPDGNSLLSLAGVAKNFESIALQSKIFKKNTQITNPIFFGFNIDERGKVTFSFEAIIEHEFFLYNKSVKLPKLSQPSEESFSDLFNVGNDFVEAKDAETGSEIETGNEDVSGQNLPTPPLLPQ